eukprot:scaffold105902_cov66-Phaeocystis_antarctica.AAC.2
MYAGGCSSTAATAAAAAAAVTSRSGGATATGRVEAASRVAPHPSPLPTPNGSSALSLAARRSVRAASMGKPARAQVCTAQPSRSAHVSSRIATAAAWQPGGISGDPGDLQRRWAPSQSTCARMAADRAMQARSRSRCAKRGSVVALAMATTSMFGVHSLSTLQPPSAAATAKTHSRWSEKVPQRGSVAGSGGQRPAESGGPLGGCGGGCGGRGSGLDIGGGGGAGLSSSARRSMGCGCRSANRRSSRVVCRAIEA